MNPNWKRLAACGLVLSLFAPFISELEVARAIAPQRRQSVSKARISEPVGDVFRNNCARCHGADGRGDTPLGNTYKAPDFTDSAWWQKNSKTTSSAGLISIVSRGKAGMPAFGKKLSRTEIRRLVGYVRRFKNQESSH
jgi:mono/diheme cytochrome c family protein